MTCPCLSPRHRALFAHRVHVYRVMRPGDLLTGEPLPDYYEKAVENMPCRYTYTDNTTVPFGAGRAEKAGEFTRDSLSFPLGYDVRDADYVVNVTPGSPLYGVVHRIQGDPRQVVGSPRRPIEKQDCLMMSDAKPPKEILP